MVGLPPLSTYADRYPGANAAASVALLSTYPPVRCGLATFSAALVAGMVAHDAARQIGVIGVGETHGCEDDRVVGHLTGGDADQLAAVVAMLERYDATVVQFEYGIFPGADGASVVDLLRELRHPAVTVLHTVLAAPSPSQRRVLEQVAEVSAAVVVMTEVARSRLLAHYLVDPDRVWVIPHGSASPGRALRASPSSVSGGRRPVLLTWGLLGPGKGIELAIDALAELRDLEPVPRFIVAGQTHPKVREHMGESYRHMLEDRARDRGVDAMIEFDNRYLDRVTLDGLLAAADIVVLAYESREQVTSGVLVDAIGAGCPVVATAFPHAIETSALGAGLTVPHDDAGELAAALRRVLTDTELAADLRATALRIGQSWGWDSIGGRYLGLVNEVTGGRPPVRYVSTIDRTLVGPANR